MSEEIKVGQTACPGCGHTCDQHDDEDGCMQIVDRGNWIFCDCNWTPDEIARELAKKQADELAALRAENEKLTAENGQLFQIANRAMAYVLSIPNGMTPSAELHELDYFMAHKISEDLWNRLDGNIPELSD